MLRSLSRDGTPQRGTGTLTTDVLRHYCRVPVSARVAPRMRIGGAAAQMSSPNHNWVPGVAQVSSTDDS